MQSDNMCAAVFAYLVAVAAVICGLRPGADRKLGWVLGGVLALGGTGFLLRMPAVCTGIDRFCGVANLSYLLYTCDFLACVTLTHGWLNGWVDATPAAGPGARVAGAARAAAPWLAGGCGIGLLVLLFLAGSHPRERPVDFSLAYRDDAPSVAMTWCYLLCFGGGWVLAAIRVHRARIAARGSESRWPAISLGFLETAIFVSVVYTLVMSSVPLWAAAGAKDAPQLDAIADAVGAASALLACVGFACRIIGPCWEAYVLTRMSGLAARRQYRQLESLYRLTVAGADSGMGRATAAVPALRDPTTALAHRVLAIADAHSRIADYRDERTEALAAEWGAALTEVIMLDAAARAHRAGERMPAARMETRADLRDEIDHYLRLASAFAMLQTAQAEAADRPDVRLS